MKQLLLKSAAMLLCIALVGCSAQSTSQISSSSPSSKDALSSAATSAQSSNNPSSQASSQNPSSALSSKASSTLSSQSASSSNSSTQNYEKYSGTRDPFYWPFAATSIWNMPIGSDAKLKKTEFDDTISVGIDTEYIVRVKDTDPIVELWSAGGSSISSRYRWPGKEKTGTMRVPNNFIVADVTENSTPNNCAAFLQPDGRTIIQLQACTRVVAGAQIVGSKHKSELDIYGDGIQGTHWGSGLSAIGGTIRKGELTSDEPIRHALKLNVWANRYLYYDPYGERGWVWPADRHDSYANGSDENRRYGGTIKELRMGSLLTIPKDVTPERLKLKTQVAIKLFYALQNYGCYITDDSAWSTYDWCAEVGVREEVKEKYGVDMKTSTTSNDPYYSDMMKLVANLYIVTNNKAKSIGGGGTPCQPLAPDFK